MLKRGPSNREIEKIPFFRKDVEPEPESSPEPSTSPLLQKWRGGLLIGLYILQCFAVLALLGWVGYITHLVNGIKQPVQFQLTSPEVGLDNALVYGINSDRPLYFVQCTNQSGTYNELQIKNHKKYAAGILCEIPANTCLESVCNADLRCQERLKAASTCAQDSDCFTDPLYGSGYRCSLTNCSCVLAPVSSLCANNSDCPQDPLNPCASFVCNTTSGQCVNQYLGGSTCSSDIQCAAANGGDTNWFCNATGGAPCACIFSPPVVLNNTVCATDANCPQRTGDTCGAFLCNMTAEACIYALNNGSQCSTNEDCSRINDSFNWFCNQTSCQCVFSNTTGGGGGSSASVQYAQFLRTSSLSIAQSVSSQNITFSSGSSSNSTWFSFSGNEITIGVSGTFLITYGATCRGTTGTITLQIRPQLDAANIANVAMLDNPENGLDRTFSRTFITAASSGNKLRFVYDNFSTNTGQFSVNPPTPAFIVTITQIGTLS